MTSTRSDRKSLQSHLWPTFGEMGTDQQKRIPHPPLEEPFPGDLPQIELVAPDALTVGTLAVREAIARRRSYRAYADTPLTLEELSYLVWATQGVQEIWRGGVALRRTVPSAGARHPFETYLIVHRVEGLEVGLYRYLSVEHSLLQLRLDPEMPAKVAAACNRQRFIAASAVTFVWTAVPYRTEWRYGVMAPKFVSIDAGHVCQSLYLAAGSIDAGVCAIAAYDQTELDALLGVDGEDEFAVYVAPVGKV
jgi:SagB-type dehydrogenase family enzyme